jgi:hypothetical protein
MSFLKPDTPQIAAPVQPALPPPVMSPQGSKPGVKPSTKTFLGPDTIANPAQGRSFTSDAFGGGDMIRTSGGQLGKTLLGS